MNSKYNMMEWLAVGILLREVEEFDKVGQVSSIIVSLMCSFEFNLSGMNLVSKRGENQNHTKTSKHKIYDAYNNITYIFSTRFF